MSFSLTSKCKWKGSIARYVSFGLLYLSHSFRRVFSVEDKFAFTLNHDPIKDLVVMRLKDPKLLPRILISRNNLRILEPRSLLQPSRVRLSLYPRDRLTELSRATAAKYVQHLPLPFQLPLLQELARITNGHVFKPQRQRRTTVSQVSESYLHKVRDLQRQSRHTRRLFPLYHQSSLPL